MPKKKVSFSIDKDVIDSFKRYCKTYALHLSAKVELMMKQEMDYARKEENRTLLTMFKEMIGMQKKAPKAIKTQVAVNKPLDSSNPKMIDSGRVPTIDELRLKKI